MTQVISIIGIQCAQLDARSWGQQNRNGHMTLLQELMMLFTRISNRYSSTCPDSLKPHRKPLNKESRFTDLVAQRSWVSPHTLPLALWILGPLFPMVEGTLALLISAASCSFVLVTSPFQGPGYLWQPPEKGQELSHITGNPAATASKLWTNDLHIYRHPVQE